MLRGDYLVCSAGNLKSSLERVFKDAAVVAAGPLSPLTNAGRPHTAARKNHIEVQHAKLTTQHDYRALCEVGQPIKVGPPDA